MTKALIENVSDTALWVASYRAKETSRSDALFQDPLAAKLAGERGIKIAESTKSSRYTEWVVVMRTVIIDRFLNEKIKEGVDTILNLGAGLDTRPYRMDLPRTLRWIEVDFPRIVDLKEQELVDDVPRCYLKRLRVDLANPEASKKCFAEIAASSSNILVLTEGVIPYLTNEQVAGLANQLYAHPQFRYWIAEYISPEAVKQMQKPERMRHLKNAPFVFNPNDWIEFFKVRGWWPLETQYFAIESIKLGRPVPAPWWAKILQIFLSASKLEHFKKFAGFILFERK